MSFPLSYSLLETANMALTARSAAVGTAKQLLVKWDPDLPEASAECFIVILGPDDAGFPARKKWWRGVTVHGSGSARVLFFNVVTTGQAVFVKEGLIPIIDDGQNLNTFYVPRGTKGFYAIVILIINGRLDDVDLLFDPLGSVEQMESWRASQENLG